MPGVFFCNLAEIPTPPLDTPDNRCYITGAAHDAPPDPPDAGRRLTMGLDQYAYAIKDEPGLPDTDLRLPERTMLIAQWRKHPNLQGWMQRLYTKKGGKDEQFNCATVRVTADDLHRLEQEVCNNALPSTSGFFFGVSSAEDVEDDMEFIHKAREAMGLGLAIYYTSWW